MGVLVVDDAEFMRTIIKGLLNQNGIEVVGEAENGVEAIEKYKELEPKLVTMDITMPEMNGLEAIKEIIKIDPKAKIVVCSAMGQQTLVVEAIKAGAKTFVVKPLDQKKFISEVKALL